jgi:hypothetical protein
LRSVSADRSEPRARSVQTAFGSSSMAASLTQPMHEHSLHNSNEKSYKTYAKDRWEHRHEIRALPPASKQADCQNTWPRQLNGGIYNLYIETVFGSSFRFG